MSYSKPCTGSAFEVRIPFEALQFWPAESLTLANHTEAVKIAAASTSGFVRRATMAAMTPILLNERCQQKMPSSASVCAARITNPAATRPESGLEGAVSSNFNLFSLPRCAPTQVSSGVSYSKPCTGSAFEVRIPFEALQFWPAESLTLANHTEAVKIAAASTSGFVRRATMAAIRVLGF